ncbi:MAG: HAD family phosphatase [Ruminococcaceae bacterium]|jgi:HAD superfamily hydrolase (TIGR01509 family)|nr:HAD family phosphatase [Oscillospiraceae bacterium]
MQGAIFDMDGLLIDSERIWQSQWRAIAAERGITLPDSFPGEICGTAGARTLEVLRLRFQTEDAQTVRDECARRVHKLEENGVPLKPGARDILTGLRAAGWRVAVASSSPMDMIRHNLSLDGIDGYFDALVSGQEVANGKPWPDIFLRAAEKLGLAPEECYVLEDSLSGVEAGWRAGCRTIMVPDLMQPTDEARARCFRICRDLNEAWETMRA